MFHAYLSSKQQMLVMEGYLKIFRKVNFLKLWVSLKVYISFEDHFLNQFAEEYVHLQQIVFHDLIQSLLGS